MTAVRPYLGRSALGLAVLGWLLLLVGLAEGGLDPTPEQYNTLRALASGLPPKACRCRSAWSLW
jgi:hypothetical protein